MFDSNRAQETAENNLIEKMKDSVQLMEGIDEDEVCGVQSEVVAYNDMVADRKV